MNYTETYGQSWALVIGIDKYQHVSPLAHATNDAAAMATTLRDQFGFPESNLTILLDEDASAHRIRECFLSFCKTAPDDRLIVSSQVMGIRFRGAVATSVSWFRPTANLMTSRL